MALEPIVKPAKFHTAQQADYRARIAVILVGVTRDLEGVMPTLTNSMDRYRLGKLFKNMSKYTRSLIKARGKSFVKRKAQSLWHLDQIEMILDTIVEQQP